MNALRNSYLIFSFISALGDSIFLFGLPLYFYKYSGQLQSTSYVSIIIVISIILFKNIIITFNRKNQLKLVGFGELIMAMIELIQLIILINWINSPYIILVFLPLLAFTYNIYSSSKRMVIQDYFILIDKVKYNTIQNILDKLGRILGLFLSSIILKWYSVQGLIFVEKSQI